MPPPASHRRRAGHVIVLRLLALATVALFGQVLHALPADRDQPIQIQADWAELDQRKGTATYGGDVHMTQGSIQVHATRVVIYTEHDKVARITADGSATEPAHYQQQPKPDQPPIQATAQHIVYVTTEQRIELVGNAQLSQRNNQFKGAAINYDIGKEVVSAKSGTGTGGRVSATFDPNQRR